MVEAIQFAVRTSAGNIVHGNVAGEGGSEFLQIGSGESVSLNLSQSSVLAYEHQGNDLILKLADGRAIVLSNYFEANVGEDNKLYLSTNGEVTEVFLTDGGDGVMYANYGPVDTWNKSLNIDDLRSSRSTKLNSDPIASYVPRIFTLAITVQRVNHVPPKRVENRLFQRPFEFILAKILIIIDELLNGSQIKELQSNRRYKA